MKTTAKKQSFITIEQALKAGNDGQNQTIKGDFVGKHVYQNLNSLVEYCLTKGYEDGESPINGDNIINFYSYPEWSETVIGEKLYFEGGTEDEKEAFLDNFQRLKDESDELLTAGTISEATHERNCELVDEAQTEFETLETEAAEIFEWWGVSEYLFEKLRAQGCAVVDAGSCYVWGRTTTGQAILLDGVITRICADMGILEGQEYSWARK